MEEIPTPPPEAASWLARRSLSEEQALGLSAVAFAEIFLSVSEQRDQAEIDAMVTAVEWVRAYHVVRRDGWSDDFHDAIVLMNIYEEEEEDLPNFEDP